MKKHKNKKMPHGMPEGMRETLMALKDMRTAKPGECFVETTFRRKIPNGRTESMEGHKRASLKTADPDKIIRCNYCNKPAVHIDHLWPIHEELTYCEDHKSAYDEKHPIDFHLLQEHCRHQVAYSCDHQENLGVFVGVFPKITPEPNSLKCCMENCPLWKILRAMHTNTKLPRCPRCRRAITGLAFRDANDKCVCAYCHLDDIRQFENESKKTNIVAKAKS